MKNITLENIRIQVVDAVKLVTVDDWNHGQDPNTTKQKELSHASMPYYLSVVEAFNDIISGGPVLTAKDIRTFDPNIYIDPGARVVNNNTAAGKFRCLYDREENDRGLPPSEQQMGDFKAGKIKLKAATYEIHFRVLVVGLEEDALADFLEVTRPDA